MAKQLGDDAAARSDQGDLLIAMLDNDGASYAALAECLGWSSKSRVHKYMEDLKRDGLVKNERGAAILSEKGQKAAKKAKLNSGLAGSKYG